MQEYRDASAALLLVGTPLLVISLIFLAYMLLSEYGFWGWWHYYKGIYGPVPGFLGLALVCSGIKAMRSASAARRELN